MITVPEGFAEVTLRREGEAGRAWLGRLPQQVETLCRTWGLSIDGPVLYGGLSLVVLVRRGEEPCALRIPWPHASQADEVAALRAWNGNGAVKVLEANDLALLLERLDPGRTLEGLPIAEALKIAGWLLRRLAVAAPPSSSFPTLQAQVQAFERDWPRDWERAGRPFPRTLLDSACRQALERAATASASLVHTDLHFGNVLAGTREPWLATDPRVVVGDLEYGVAPLLWTRLDELEAGGGVQWGLEVLVDAAQLNLDLARRWSVVRCLDYWLWGLNHGLTIDPERCRRVVAGLRS
ncbi:aminoglycoside phosphotransferase family protein [Deinococcus irradiatisoli]|uniref:aminoglycoside phosphotransferase family protein n=1 Tax=Deinococcus irradiatisoli TaxID=2202254 RepID=UPI0015E8570B|nr:aminoglycoside phosphotransferase family protein [Deinococcus irradiatisoli]